MPDVVFMESDALSPDTIAALRKRGHSIEVRAQLGEVAAVRRLRSGELEAAADPRGPGAAAVVNPGPN